MPEHTFCIGLIAPKGAGKTTLIINLITNEHMYKGYFHKIHVFSPSINNDDKWETVRQTKHLVCENKRLAKLVEPTHARTKAATQFVIVRGGDKAGWQKEKEEQKGFNGMMDETCFHTRYTQDTLQQLIDEQNAMNLLVQKKLADGGQNKAKAKYYLDRQLWIFDDQVGSTLFKMSNNENAFNKLATSSRHLSCSWIVVSQAYKAIPAVVRTNVFQLVLFRVPNQKELEKVYEENPCDLPKDTWLQVYNECTAEKYGFMFINYNGKHRICKNFTTELCL